MTSLLPLPLLLLSALPAAVSQCPMVMPPCICSPSILEPISILCDGAFSLNQVVASLQPAKDSRIDGLVISNTPFITLPAKSGLENFTISRLAFHKNGFYKIDDAAFDGKLLNSLVDLDLGSNKFGEVPQDGVPKLKNLRKLSLRDNKLNAVPADAFKDYESVGKLVSLDLSKNYIGDFGKQSPFRRMKELRDLNLQHNYLTKVPTPALLPLRSSLRDLNLGSNQIKSLPPGSFDLPNLVSLSVEFNDIPQIVPQVFRGTPNLLYLYLTGGYKNTMWDPEMFRYTPKLKVLSIGETPILKIPLLVRLGMSESALTEIEDGALQAAQNLEAVVLNRCRLTRVSRGMFQGLESLSSLDLASNLIESVEPLGFARLPALRHLDLSFNRLSSLPEDVLRGSFPPTADSISLYLCGNPWNCDRRLESMRQWLRENPVVQIEKDRGCLAQCNAPDWLPPNWPLRQRNPNTPQPATRNPTTIGSFTAPPFTQRPETEAPQTRRPFPPFSPFPSLSPTGPSSIVTVTVTAEPTRRPRTTTRRLIPVIHSSTPFPTPAPSRPTGVQGMPWWEKMLESLARLVATLTPKDATDVPLPVQQG